MVTTHKKMMLLGLGAALLLAVGRGRAQDVAPGFIRVNTEPAGAAVYLDGVMKDVSPVVISDVEPGEHLLTISKDGYLEARRTVRLEPEQRLVVEQRLEPILGLVVINSSPDEAFVQINDADRGQTPLLLTDLPLGTYRMRLTRPGYIAKQLELRIEDRIPRKLNVELQSSSAKLTLSSNPSGANVILNGIAMGMTPCELGRIPSGESVIEVTYAGYQPFKRTMTLQAGQEEELDVVLQPVPSELVVVSIPEKARVYVDNQYRGEAPLTLEDIEPGEYRVRAELPGYSALARNVVVPRNSNIVEEFRLEANSGILELTTEPAGVRVFIDGDEVGVTTAEEDETDRVSQPFMVRLVTEGEHKVQLSLEGYFAEDFTVEIKRDETATRHVKLKRRFIPNYEVQTMTGTERGVLLEIDLSGNIRLEVRPGIIKAIPAEDVKSGRPLRGE